LSTQGNGIILVPGKHREIKGISPDRTKYQLAGYQDFLDTHLKLFGSDPYSKLQTITLFWHKIHEPEWVSQNAGVLLDFFFLLVFDRGLLFPQTRERVSVQKMQTLKDYLINAEYRAFAEKQEYLSNAVDAVSRLFSQPEKQSAVKKVMTLILEDELRKRRGRPVPLVSCPPGLRDELQYRNRGESEEAWQTRRRKELYDQAKILGISAQHYYDEKIKAHDVSFDIWVEVVTDQLWHVQERLDAGRGTYKGYIPFFTYDQVYPFERACAEAKEHADRFKNSMSCVAHGEIFLSNTLSYEEKFEKFKVEWFDRYIRKCNVSSEDAGILFVQRARLHPLLRGRAIHRIPIGTEGISVREGIRFFDAIQENINQCLDYTAEDMLSIDNIFVHKEEYREKSMPWRRAVFSQLNQLLPQIEEYMVQYAKIFTVPANTWKELLDKILEDISEKVDWDKISFEGLCSKGGLTQRRKCLSVWKHAIVEDYLLKCLSESGREDLKDIGKFLMGPMADRYYEQSEAQSKKTGEVFSLCDKRC